MRRPLPVLVLAVLAGCAPTDPLPGAYHFTMTGTDTSTAPTTGTSTPTGSGTISISRGVATDYVLVLAQSDTTACVLTGAKVKDQPLAIALSPNQTCTFPYPLGSATASLTTDTFSLDSATHDVATLALAYSYAGSFLGINYAGTGTRTYTGSRY